MTQAVGQNLGEDVGLYGEKHGLVYVVFDAEWLKSLFLWCITLIPTM